MIAEAKTKGLTPRQRQIWEWMIAYQRDNGMPPAIREIGEAHGITSPNGVVSHLYYLHNKGYTRQVGEGGKSRCWLAVVPGERGSIHCTRDGASVALHVAGVNIYLSRAEAAYLCGSIERVLA